MTIKNKHYIKYTYGAPLNFGMEDKKKKKKSEEAGMKQNSAMLHKKKGEI